MTRDQVVMAATVITLVWRSTLGQWMVHAIGEYVMTEGVPHG
jgi:hypothetical protein